METVEDILPVKNALGEGPLWAADSQALYWVDFGRSQIWRFFPEGNKAESFNLPVPVSALAERRQGGFILVTRDGLAEWSPETAEFRPFANPEEENPGVRLNDAAVDRQGRLWFGSLCRRGNASLFCLDWDRSLRKVDSPYKVSNGIGWSPDNQVMYFTDSFQNTIFAFDFDPASGEIDQRRPFITTPEGDGVPDGLTVDAQGFLWSVRCGGWKVCRYDPAGRLEREIRLPVQYPTSCMFGGPALDELYITSSWSLAVEADRLAQSQAGNLFRFMPGVGGLAEPKFSG